MMTQQLTLERKLSRARRMLMIMYEEAAWFGNMQLPNDLQQDIQDQLAEIAHLEQSLSQIDVPKDESLPDNLPLVPSTFVGRSEDIAQCLALLTTEDPGWGVAIDGESGVGKTALAIKLAHEARRRNWFDAYLFFSARTTWHAETGTYLRGLGRSPLDTFIREFALLLGKEPIARMTNTRDRRREFLDQLQHRRVLLVLDNLETLTPAEHDLIAVFLHNLPLPSKAIITSKHRIGIRGKSIRLGPLSEQDMLTLMTNLGYRYPRVSAEVSSADMGLRLALCRVSGGNPLVLHSAFGLIAGRGFSLKHIVAWLENAPSAREAYELLFAEAVRGLGRPERVVLSTLAVFQNPATPRTLIEVTRMDATRLQVAIERLLTLALIHDMRGGHYGLHPTTRSYVTDLLVSGEKATRHRSRPQPSLETSAYHQALRYWVDYAQRHGGDKHGAGFRRLEQEWLNLEATAVALYDHTGLPGHLVEKTLARMFNDLALALRVFMRSYGYWDEWLRLSTWGYELAIALEDWHHASWRAYDAAFVHLNRNETEQAALWADRMASAVQKSQEQRDRVVATRLQGLVAEQRGELVEAERWYLAALAACRRTSDRRDELSLLNDLGELYIKRHNYEQARVCLSEALLLGEKKGDKENQVVCLGNLGTLALIQEQFEEAEALFRRELALAEELGQQDLIVRARANLAKVRVKQKPFP